MAPSLPSYFVSFGANIFPSTTNLVIKQTQPSRLLQKKKKNSVADDRGGAERADDFIRRVPASRLGDPQISFDMAGRRKHLKGSEEGPDEAIM